MSSENKEFVKEIKKRKVHLLFIYYIWGDDLDDMQLLSKFNKGIRFLLWVIVNIFSKDDWVFFKKKRVFTDAFQIILSESGRKPNKIWVD